MANSLWANDFDPSQYGGLTNLGMSLLAHSNDGGGFGSIFGKSALGAQQQYQDNQMRQYQLQQLAAQSQLAQIKAAIGRTLPGANQVPGQAPVPTGAPPAMGVPPMAPVGAMAGGAQGATQGSPQGAPQGPPQGASMAPPGQGHAPSQGQAPAWLTPPTPDQLRNMPVDDRSPGFWKGWGFINDKDPMTTNKEILDRQRALEQEQYAPVLGKLDTVRQSDTAAREVAADPELKAAWRVLAPQYGRNPDTDFNNTEVRKVFTYARNNLATSIGQPGVAPVATMIQGRAPDGRLTQTDPITGKVTYESAGPDVISAEDRFKNAIESQRLEMEKATKGVPSGYEKAPTTDDPTAIRFIPGGPADPMAAGGGLGSRNEVMFQRVVSSAQAATRAMRNIIELPISTSSGWLGGYQPGTGLFGATKSVLAQKVSPQDVQDYKTMLAGVSRNLATVETAGLSPGGSLTHSLDSLQIGEGDTNMTKLRKMAEMRQILEENLGPQLANPKLPPSQRELVRGIIQSAQEAVPFTQSDITKLQHSTKSTTTIMDFAKSQGLGTPAAASPAPAVPAPAAPTAATPRSATAPNVSAAPSLPPVNDRGWQLHHDAKGNYAYVSPDGKSYQAVK